MGDQCSLLWSSSHPSLNPIHLIKVKNLNALFPFISAGNPHTAAEALLMLLESPPEPLASPMEEECLYADTFDKACETVKVLSGPKKNTFLYICMFLNEVLKYSQYNHLDATKLGKFNYNCKENPLNLQ